MNHNKKSIQQIVFSILVCLVLIALIVLTVDFIEYKRRLKKIRASVYEGVYVPEIDRLSRINQSLIHTILSEQDKGKESSFFEKVYRMVVEEETSSGKVAKAYEHLAMIEHQKQDSLSVYKAISECSYGLDIDYNESNARFLSKILIEGYQQQAKEAFLAAGLHYDENTFINGYREDEQVYLNALIQSECLELKLRACYRLSFIHRLGRSSSLEVYNPDMEKAAMYKQLVLNQQSIQPRYVDVICTIDKNYAPHVLTWMASILLSADLDTYCRFHIVTDPEDVLSEDIIKQFQTLKNIQNCSVAVVPFPEEWMQKYSVLFNPKSFKPHKPWPRLVMFKLMLEQLFLDIDSAVVLDVDMIINRDLYRLQHQADLDEYIMAASTNKDYSLHDQLYPYYINGGNLVVNFKKMRLDNTLDQLCNTVNYLGSVPGLNEQDLINLTFQPQGKIKILSKRWNSLSYHNLNKKGVFNFRRVDISPFIIHYYAGKPWSVNYQEQVNRGEPVDKNIRIYWAYKKWVDYCLQK
jgi:lipopolysaccharide biosynthesis glycosyltransferase